DARARPLSIRIRRRAGCAVAARRRRARGLDLADPASAEPAAELDRRGRRPRLRARLPVRGRRAVHSPLPNRRGARALADYRDRLAAASADPLLRATDAAEALVAEGVPFRDAHEQVAAQVRAGTFEAPPAGDRLGDVTKAVAAAKERWS